MSVFTSLQKDSPDVRGTLRALGCILLSVLSCFFMNFIAPLFANQGVITLVLMIVIGVLDSLMIVGIGFWCSHWKDSADL